MSLRILFVCTGNICRSPLAEAILRHRLELRGLASDYQIDSCGLAADHLGQQSDARMRREARRHGIDINHRARRLEHGEMDRTDLIVGMDRWHMRSLQEMASRSSQPGLVRQMLEFLSVDDARHGEDVPDPWYGGPEGFELVFELVDQSCARLTGMLADGTLEGLDAGKPGDD